MVRDEVQGRRGEGGGRNGECLGVIIDKNTDITLCEH